MSVGSVGRIMRQLALTTAQQRRLERLARDAGRTSKAMLQFALRDGVEACEEDVRENLAAYAQFASAKSVAPNEALRRVRVGRRSHTPAWAARLYEEVGGVGRGIGLPNRWGVRCNARPVAPAGESQEEAAGSGRKVSKGEQRCLRYRGLEFRVQFFSKRIL